MNIAPPSSPNYRSSYATELEHPIKWNNFELLVPVRNYFPRQSRDSSEIFKNQTIPQQLGKPLHAAWTRLFV